MNAIFVSIPLPKTFNIKIQAYLVFGNLLRVKINVFFAKEFISDFCDIRLLLQV